MRFARLPPPPRLLLSFLLLVSVSGSQERADLWRLPGLDAVRHPSHASLRSFSASLQSRGFARNASSRGAAWPRVARAVHAPFSHSLAHTAIYEGFGLVSLNYTSSLRAEVVHLDEFMPLFAALDVRWTCDSAPPGACVRPRGACGALHAVRCVRCAACAALCAMCGALRAVRGALRAVRCALRCACPATRPSATTLPPPAPLQSPRSLAARLRASCLSPRRGSPP